MWIKLLITKYIYMSALGCLLRAVCPEVSAQMGVSAQRGLPRGYLPPPPTETDTEAGGTHPTGMHSCS